MRAIPNLLLFLIPFLFTSELFALSVTAVSAATVDSNADPSKVYIPTISAMCTQIGVYPSSLTLIDQGSANNVIWFDITPTKTSTDIKGSNTSNDFSVIVHLKDTNSKLVPLVTTSGVAGYDANNYYYSSPYALKYNTTFGNTMRVGIPVDAVNGQDYCTFLTANGTGQAGNDCDVDSTTTAPYDMALDMCIANGTDKCDDSKADKETFKLVLVNCPPAYGGTITPDFSVTPLDGQVKLKNSTVTPSDTVNVAGLLMYSKESTTAVAPTFANASTKQFINGTSGQGTYTFENLSNELQYCFNLAYVNVGGLVSQAGTIASGAEKCATPSKIEGFLNRSTCFIATAAFGSEMDSRVELLREFRNQILLKTDAGLKFVEWYYSWSPRAADYIRERPVLKGVIRYALYPVVAVASVILFLKTHFVMFINSLGLLLLFAVLRRYRPRKEIVFSLITFASTLFLFSSSSLASELNTEMVLPQSAEKFSAIEKLDDPQVVQPYIESLKKGKTLEAKIDKKPKNTFGLTVNVATSFTVKSSQQQANSFEKVYTPGSKYAYGFNIFYEYQWFKHRIWGTLGPIGQMYFINLKGKGVFTNRGESSEDVNMVFTAFPFAAGASYRYTPLRLLVPFVQFSYAGIPVMEKRDDGKSPRRAISAGTLISFGASLSLDWISKRSYWDQYENNDVIHSYLTVQRHMLRSTQGPVSFNYDATYLGLLFEI